MAGTARRLLDPPRPVVRYVDRLLVHPVRTVPLTFFAASLAGAALLATPLAARSGQATPLIDALFTAVSALCVTGLVTLDTGTHWSAFGLGVILLLIQIGGLGLMVSATMIGSLFWSRLSIANQHRAGAEISALTKIGDFRRAVRLIGAVALGTELVLALLLAARFYLGYDMPVLSALWHGVFHAVSAFNNAGFGLSPDSLVRFSADALVLVPIAMAIMVGGIGFPVLWDLARKDAAPNRWSLHSKVTLAGTALLLVAGAIATCLFEWNGALGQMSVGERLLNAGFYSVSLRTAGFNNFAMDALTDQTLIASSMLMLVGGGVAGTAGGIKVGTAMLVLLILLSELRGHQDVTAFGRRIATAAQRRAVAMVLLALLLVVFAALFLAWQSDLPMRDVAFETISAFATVGLSTGVTAQFDSIGKMVLVLLMFVGRVGPLTLGAALLLRHRPATYRYPEEELIIA